MNLSDLISGSHKLNSIQGVGEFQGTGGLQSRPYSIPSLGGPTPPGYKHRILHEDRLLLATQSSEDTAMILLQFIEVS